MLSCLVSACTELSSPSFNERSRGREQRRTCAFSNESFMMIPDVIVRISPFIVVLFFFCVVDGYCFSPRSKTMAKFLGDLLIRIFPEKIEGKRRKIRKNVDGTWCFLSRSISLLSRSPGLSHQIFSKLMRRCGKIANAHCDNDSLRVD